ncbi:MAG: hypothetical protein QM778_27960 [Myxococcales bacterium]
MRTWLGLLLALLWTSQAEAAPVSSISQYGVTWTFDHAHESGQFATGDYWVVGPVVVQSVSPAPTGMRNGSCVNPMGGRQGYDSRGGEYKTEDQVSFPRTFQAGQSIVSSVSKPEGAVIMNAGNMVSQAVLTVVDAPQPSGTFRPAFAGTYKKTFNLSQIHWDRLPKLPTPKSAPSGAQLLVQADRPRADHLSSWTIQFSCAEENWNNGPGEHACYGREVSAFISAAALHVLLDTPQQKELAASLIQLGIDNYGILKAGGNWAPNGGHHSGRKWPIVFAAALLDDCEMKALGTDYDDATFGEDGQTYFGAGGKALFGWDCGDGFGDYFGAGCSGSGAKDCRDPAGVVDGCIDYRNCCTSGYWVGQMLSASMLGAKSLWNHDAYFDYVDRWMAGDVADADGADPFSEEMWTLYREHLPLPALSRDCVASGPDAGGTSPDGGSDPSPGDTKDGGSSSSAGSDASASTMDGSASDPTDATHGDGCGCRVHAVQGQQPSLLLWLAILALCSRGILRRRRARAAAQGSTHECAKR